MITNYTKITKQTSLTNNIILINCQQEEYPLLQSSMQCIINYIPKSWQQHIYNVDKHFDITQIITDMNNPSLFNDGDFYQINFTTTPNAKQVELLKTIVKQANQSNFIMINLSLDYKAIKAAWVSDISKSGEFLVLGDNPQDINHYIEYTLHNNNLSISNEAKNELVNLNKSNLSQLAQSLNNLSNLFHSGYTISLDDIKTHIMNNSEYSIYNIASLLLIGKKTEAYKLILELSNETENLILLVWLLNEDIKKLIKLKSLMRNTSDLNGSLRNLRVYGSNVQDFILGYNRISYSNLVEIQGFIARLDGIIKGVYREDIGVCLLRISLSY